MLKIRKSLLVGSILSLCFFLTGQVFAEQKLSAVSLEMNSAKDFFQNPNGVWSYGWKATRNSPFILYNKHFQNSEGLSFWITNNYPLISFNNTGNIIHSAGTTTIEPGMLVMHPGANGEYSVLRLKFPLAGTYFINAIFTGVSGYNGAPSTTTDVAVIKDNQVLYEGYVNLKGNSNATAYSTNLTVNAGETIEFLVGYGNGNYSWDSTAVDISVRIEI